MPQIIFDPDHMTGYTVHTGSSKKFAQGWDQVFQGKTGAKAAKPALKKSASPSAPARRKSK